MRGEYPWFLAQEMICWELPPHARRIRFLGYQAAVGFGTTSACAENTAWVNLPSLPKRNYLRMRGEYGANLSQYTDAMELPPHARRIPFLSKALRRGLGTTSACAENTFRKP